MTHQVIIKVVRLRLKELNMSPYQLHVRLAGRVSKQTVYNFIKHREVIKSDTLAAIMDVLGLTVSKIKGARTFAAPVKSR